MDIKLLTQDISVSPQIKPSDMEKIKAQGFKTLINNRPDREVRLQPSTKTLKARAQKAGLNYYHLPVISGRMSQDNIDQFAELLAKVDGPVLAFCRTGTRCVNLWARANPHGLSPHAISDIGAQAGYVI